MKYVFFGSPRFARIVLETLLDSGFPPAALVTNPDKPAGRKHILTPPETKQLLSERFPETVIFQPEKLREIRENLVALNPDFFVVAAYAKIIPQSILDIPRLGTIGVHPSLLPRYRGASPIQSALLHGETSSGVTLYLLGAGVDDGPVFAQKNLAIGENENYAELEGSLAALGGKMLAELIPHFLEGKAETAPQEDAKATLTKKFVTQDGFIDEQDLNAAKENPDLARTLHDKIRALGKEPGAWTVKNGKRLKLLRSAIKNGRLLLSEIQWEGKKPETVTDYSA
jgi:methionyl-tRNA formyltransferase